MEKKKTSIRIAQESRKKNNKTGYFIGYITVMNGMSAFALAVAWCWGMSAIFHMEMDTKMILLWLLLISMRSLPDMECPALAGSVPDWERRQQESGISGTSVSGLAERCSDSFGKGAAGNVEHLYQNIEMVQFQFLS